MNLRRLVTLTPYRMPAHHPLMLGDEFTTAWLFADRALWHPGLLAWAEGLPQLSSPDEHAEPSEGTLYAVPAEPKPYLPDDWDERVRDAGGAAFRTGATWNETVANLRTALSFLTVEPSLVDHPEPRDYFGVGFGLRVIEALAEAMEHPSLLDAEAFSRDLKAGAVQAAAERLLAARDGLYPVAIHLIALALLDDGPPAASFHEGLPFSLVASAHALERLNDSERATIRQRIEAATLELCGGVALERPDAVLPVESQLWNLRHGCVRTAELVGSPPAVYGRATTSFFPDLPARLALVRVFKALCLSFDGAGIPNHSSASIRWPSPDGRAVDAMTRAAQPASDPQTGFHLAYYLHQTIMHDSAALLVLRHADRPAGLWYDDWLALSRLAPVLGTWTTVGRFLEETTVGEYAEVASADDFPPDELDAAIHADQADPVSRFARHARSRRRVDAAQSYLALLQSLGTPADRELIRSVGDVEVDVEMQLGEVPEKLVVVEQAAADALARRLVRSGGDETGWLVLNASAFARRVGLERHDLKHAPPIGGPVKAVQRDGDVTRLVVEVPGFGFAWVPATSAEPPPPRMTLAGEGFVRNEHFEAEIDAETGGIKSLRDSRDRGNRLGQQLVWAPGGTVRCDEMPVTALGPALGEVTASGRIVDAHDEVVARFRQRFRAWLGRPLLEVQITIEPVRGPTGGAWHAYYGARFAWPDERAVLHRGVAGRSAVTTHHRPGSPEFLELQSGRSRTLIVTGGLPFAQLHGSRMVDVILLPAGETATQFELFIGLDRPHPAQAAQSAVSPVAVVPLDRGPPAVGPSGWLAHLDLSDLVVTSLRPSGERAVEVRLLDVGGHGGSATLRWARPPAGADGDGVSCYVAANELKDLRVEWADVKPR